MQDPRTELYKMLAVGSALGKDRDRIHATAMSQVPRQQAAAVGELARLRKRIQSAGVGQDTESEERYLQLLKENRRFHQLQAMAPKVSTEVDTYDAALQKEIDQGRMVLDVYGGGVLVKSAISDLKYHIDRLRGVDNPEAQSVAKGLEACLKNTGLN